VRSQDAGKKLMRCAACRVAAYCDATHQREDWRRHKQECAAMLRQREQAAEDA
jgi:CDGSH-type Zn-finger protein